MKRVLPILLLGLIGCTAAPSNQSSGPSTATQSAPQSVIASPTASPQPRETTSAQVDNTAPELSKPESSPESSQTEPETADRPSQSDGTPIDEASDRTRRLETMRQMENPSVETIRNGSRVRNRNWTITTGGDWSGVNNTGNLTYEGCDVNGKCLSLKGGTASCRDGVCSMGWQNGEYFYSLQTPMTEEGQPTPSTTLKVFKGDRMILEETGLTASR